MFKPTLCINALAAFQFTSHNFHSDISELNTHLGINFSNKTATRASIVILFVVSMQSWTNRWLPLMRLLVK